MRWWNAFDNYYWIDGNLHHRCDNEYHDDYHNYEDLNDKDDNDEDGV